MDDEEYARARLEKSLGLHRAKIETLRQLENRLDARISRLSELSLAAKKLIDSMMVNPFHLEVAVFLCVTPNMFLGSVNLEIHHVIPNLFLTFQSTGRAERPRVAGVTGGGFQEGV